MKKETFYNEELGEVEITVYGEKHDYYARYWGEAENGDWVAVKTYYGFSDDPFNGPPETEIYYFENEQEAKQRALA